MDENKLEIALREAATDESARAEFYQELMRSEIFIIGSTNQTGDEDGYVTVKEGGSMNIASFQRDNGEELIPFFTSLPALQKAINAEQSFVAMQAEAFFEMTLGAQLVLNLGSDYGKEFTPHEVSMIIGKPDPALNVRRETVQEETKIMIGQPAEVPNAMLSAIAGELPNFPQISRAWLAQIVRDADGTPNLVVGLESTSDIGEVVGGISRVMEGTVPKDRHVDFMQVDPSKPSAGLSDYFTRNVEPFYRVGAKRKPFWKFWA
jgi:hypothetical protein